MSYDLFVLFVLLSAVVLSGAPLDVLRDSLSRYMQETRYATTLHSKICNYLRDDARITGHRKRKWR